MIYEYDFDTESKDILGLQIRIMPGYLPVWWVKAPSDFVDKNEVQALIEELPYIKESLEELYAKL